MTTHQVAHLEAINKYIEVKSNSYLSSDGDFEDKPAVIWKRKKQISKSSKFESDGNTSDAHVGNGHHTNISSGFTNFSSPMSLSWEQLPADIQSVLPHDEYSYVIQLYQTRKLDHLKVLRNLLLVQ